MSNVDDFLLDYEEQTTCYIPALNSRSPCVTIPRIVVKFLKLYLFKKVRWRFVKDAAGEIVVIIEPGQPLESSLQALAKVKAQQNEVTPEAQKEQIKELLRWHAKVVEELPQYKSIAKRRKYQREEDKINI